MFAERMYELTSDAFVFSDETGTIINVNPATEKMFLYPEEELIGENVTKLMDEHFALEHPSHMRKFSARATDPTRSGATPSQRMSETRARLEGRRRDGTLFPIDVMLTTSSNPSNPSGLIIAAAIRDLTDREDARTQQSRREASDQMLGYINHEIRNPLFGLQGFLALAKEQIAAIVESTPPTPQDTEFHNNLCSKLLNIQSDLAHATELSEMLNTLATDALNVRRLSEGMMTHDLQPVSVNDIARKSCHVLMPKIIANPNLTFSSQLLNDEPRGMLDANRTTQILLNLLSNAVKYTRAGTISLTLTLSETSTSPPESFSIITPHSSQIAHPFKCSRESSLADIPPVSSWVRFDVKDTGRGIPPNKQSRVFAAFTQMNSSDGNQGAGLGLHLCKGMVEHLGGSIWFTSEDGVGSTFSFELPFPDPVPLTTVRSSEGSLVDLFEQMRLKPENLTALVVDDMRTNRIFLQRALASLGFTNIKEAGSGEEALELAETTHLDILFIDSRMPGIGGHEVTRILRKNSAKYCNLVIIGITGDTHADVEAMDAGQNMVLQKPFTIQHLRHAIGKCLMDSTHF